MATPAVVTARATQMKKMRLTTTRMGTKTAGTPERHSQTQTNRRLATKPMTAVR